METNTTTAIVAELQLIDLSGKISQKEIAEKLNEIIVAVKELQAKNSSTGVTRDRGPKSEKEMTEADARSVMLGELKDTSHKVAAEKLGLSYGQVYSARKGFTFKPVYKEMIDLAKVVAVKE